MPGSNIRQLSDLGAERPRERDVYNDSGSPLKNLQIADADESTWMGPQSLRNELRKVDDEFKHCNVPSMNHLMGAINHKYPPPPKNRDGSLSETPDRNQLFRARAVVTWIAHNIKYNFRSGPVVMNEDKNGDVLVHEIEREAKLTFERRRAVCAGFASLCAILCRGVNIPCKFVTGIVNTIQNRADFDQWKQTRNGHAWNIITVSVDKRGRSRQDGNEQKQDREEKQLLVDCCWASSCSRDGSPGTFLSWYFGPPPSQFIASHFPKKTQDQLLARPGEPRNTESCSISQAIFDSFPIVNPHVWFTSNIEFVDAFEGKIRVVAGTAARLRLKVTDCTKVTVEIHTWTDDNRMLQRSGNLPIGKYPMKVKTERHGTIALLQLEVVALNEVRNEPNAAAARRSDGVMALLPDLLEGTTRMILPLSQWPVNEIIDFSIPTTTTTGVPVPKVASKATPIPVPKVVSKPTPPVAPKQMPDPTVAPKQTPVSNVVPESPPAPNVVKSPPVPNVNMAPKSPPVSNLAPKPKSVPDSPKAEVMPKADPKTKPASKAKVPPKTKPASKATPKVLDEWQILECKCVPAMNTRAKFKAKADELFRKSDKEYKRSLGSQNMHYCTANLGEIEFVRDGNVLNRSLWETFQVSQMPGFSQVQLPNAQVTFSIDEFIDIFLRAICHGYAPSSDDDDNPYPGHLYMTSGGASTICPPILPSMGDFTNAGARGHFWRQLKHDHTERKLLWTLDEVCRWFRCQLRGNLPMRGLENACPQCEKAFEKIVEKNPELKCKYRYFKGDAVLDLNNVTGCEFRDFEHSGETPSKKAKKDPSSSSSDPPPGFKFCGVCGIDDDGLMEKYLRKRFWELLISKGRIRGHKVFITSHRSQQLQDNNGQIGTSEGRGEPEKWTLKDAGDNKVFITSHRNQQLQDSHGQIGTSGAQGPTETWTISDAEGGKVYITSTNGQNLHDHDGQIGTSNNQDVSEEWTLIDAEGSSAEGTP